jgi:prepilin-type N-terminal cleavage/methylation domain-containing protein
MISKIKNQNKSVSAFTLIEMVIVLVIIGILLMATLYLSWDQIQKVRDKTVKESILAEMQSRYSRNLWSSSFAWKMYETMDVTFSWWENKIDFEYKAKNNEEGWENGENGENGENIKNTFTDKFEIKYITKNYYDSSIPLSGVNNIKLTYSPYQITCKIWGWEEEENQGENNNVVMIIRVNDSRDYCFEVQKKNCRLMEMSESKCKDLENKSSAN